MFIDFHTHHDRYSPNLINLQTLHVNPELRAENLPNVCSLGLHPWFVQIESWETAWKNLVILAKSSNVVAIGECGLDRNIALPMELQISVFQRHIELAELLQKPLVIHCVRAFAGLKEEVFQQLLKQGFYFSFGAAILSDRAPVIQAIATVPQDKFLLETDDRTDISIEQIYERAASLRHVSQETLQTQLSETYDQLTGRR